MNGFLHYLEAESNRLYDVASQADSCKQVKHHDDQEGTFQNIRDTPSVEGWIYAIAA
jgi:hypothetical protein